MDDGRVRFSPAGDCGLTVSLGDSICEETNGRVRALMDRVMRIRGVREAVPSYSSLLVLYDPVKLSYKGLQKKVEGLLDGLSCRSGGSGRTWLIPVCYEQDFAPDLGYVSEYAGMTKEDVIALHCGKDYLIYMLGFLPGFAYLGGLDERIFCPRKSTPRVKISAGSVGIGGKQTGIYPLDSPGGWQLIGKTPVLLYDENRQPPVLYGAGDHIRFCRIDVPEFMRIQAAVKERAYDIKPEVS